MTTLNFKEIYTSLKNYCISRQTKITDFNDGSIISTIFEAVSRAVERIYIDIRIGFTNLLKSIPYNLFQIKQKEGTKASARVKFSRSVAIDVTSVIPVGTLVSAGDLIFETTEPATINSGEMDSNIIGVIAKEIGAKYNVAATAINTIASEVSSDVVLVVNENKATGGTNAESENEMLERFKMYINGLQGTNTYAFKAALLSSDSIRSISIDEHFPPDNSYNYTVYIDDGTGGMTEELKNEVHKIINGDENDIVNYPGCKVPGMNYRISAASVVPITITGKVTIYRTAHTQADIDIKEILQDTIDSLSINESVLLTTIVQKLKNIPYIKDVDISQLKINNAAANVNILINQIARFESSSFEYEDLT